ncbi:chaplin family protein [Sphaerisporangium fuscum]|uniref:chaplin family protein n=1 Tax=Sphaerisporangium fuscum TaxID=2835868 RepID=UPI001BDCE0D0|nr:chaplin family protein [Sphaerisporangium fuscum]
MRTWAKGSAPAALLALGVMALGSGTAVADTSGTGSVGGGNQINLPITIPVDISGNAVAVAGEASASSRGGSSVQGGGAGAGGNRTDGRHSVLGGNQVVAPINAPVNACGNAVSLVGRSDAGCRGGAEVKGGAGRGAGGNRTDGRGSVIGGNQVVAPITAPINACGNSVAIFGEATAGCEGGASVRGGAGRGAGGNRTSGRHSVLGGNQVVAPINAPVNICGNSVALIGEAFSGCRGGASVSGGGHGGHGGHGYNGNGGSHHGGRGSGGNDTDGRYGAGSGNQIVAPITAPVNVCGNAVGNGRAECQGGISVPPGGRGGAGGNRTSGRHSVLGGNQVVAPINAPVNVCGNAVAVIGEAFAGCRGGASVKGGAGRGAGGNRTDGRGSVIGGNQVVAPITAPINACGNAVAVLGDAAAGCLGGAHVGGHGGHGSCGCGHAPRGLLARSARTPGGAEDDPGLGLLSDLPVVDGLTGQGNTSGVTRQSSQAGQAGGGLQKSLGLPALPALPGQADGSRKASASDGPLGGTPVGEVVRNSPAGGVLGDGSVGGVVRDTPAGVVGSRTRDLPTGAVGLMSAEQPMGVTGMNGGSLAALLVGAVLAASAALFAGARRLRFRQK